jgi:hypothetical protein
VRSLSLRVRAEDYRRIARTCSDAVIRDALLELADACEELADEERTKVSIRTPLNRG